MTPDNQTSTEAVSRPRRAARQSRATKETSIEVSVDLDGSGTTEISTGLPFFDHMLSQLGRHGGIDLVVAAVGDLEVDAHHTVEDVGIALGEVFAEALGDKLRWEFSQSRNQDFPHLYGALPCGAIKWARPLERDAGGQFILPST